MTSRAVPLLLCLSLAEAVLPPQEEPVLPFRRKASTLAVDFKVQNDLD